MTAIGTNKEIQSIISYIDDILKIDGDYPASFDQLSYIEKRINAFVLNHPTTIPLISLRKMHRLIKNMQENIPTPPSSPPQSDSEESESTNNSIDTGYHAPLIVSSRISIAKVRGSKRKFIEDLISSKVQNGTKSSL